MWKVSKRAEGFTLIDVLIAVGIFATATVIVTFLIFEMIKTEKRTELQSSLYTNAQLILQQITSEIQKGAIDYEEYFSQNAIQKLRPVKYYGIYYGAYGSRFFDPGKSLDGQPTNNPEDLGTECSFGSNPCEVTYTLSTDLNVGQNPFTGNQSRGNAFCDNNPACSNVSNETNELYLIDSTGTHKTIIARKLIDDNGTDDDYGIALLKMNGIDIDQNGVTDTFKCDENFSCLNATRIPNLETIFPWVVDNVPGTLAQTLTSKDITIPANTDLNNSFRSYPNASQFVPFTPLSVNVKTLKFIINPIEDPYRAFAEANVQAHPSVTILLTLGLSETGRAQYPGETLEDITVQATITAGVLKGIPSYPPTNIMDWIGRIGVSRVP